MDGRKVLGVLLLIAGIALAIFGLMSLLSLYKTTGSRSNPTGIAAIIIAAGLALAGMFYLGPNPNAPRPETHVLCPDCREPVRNEASKCKHCGCKLIPQN